MNCPECNGCWQVLLGILGKLTYLRCRDCGATWHTTAVVNPETEVTN